MRHFFFGLLLKPIALSAKPQKEPSQKKQTQKD